MRLGVLLACALMALLLVPAAVPRPVTGSGKPTRCKVVKGKRVCPKSKPKPDRTPPAIASASVNGATLAIKLSEPITSAPTVGAVTVRVSGVAYPLTAAARDGANRIVLTLSLGVPGGAPVTLSVSAGAVVDRAGNSIVAATSDVANLTPPIGAAPGAPFSWVFPKPSFADDHVVDQPWVGEWGPKADPYWLHSIGTLRGLIIPVDFPDATATQTVGFYRDLITPIAQDYYRENTYGRLALDLTFVDHWSRMPRPASTYGVAGCCILSAIRSFLEDATNLVDANVDFSQYDFVIALAPESAGPSVNILLYRPWPGEGLTRDGREIRWGIVSNGGLDPREAYPLLPHHMLTHELGHLLGLPDLYDVTARDNRPQQFAWAGAWDMMSDNRKHAHMNAWHKWLLGWLDPSQLRGVTSGTAEETITPLELPGGVKAVVVPTDASHAYVVEVRQRIGWDAPLCDKGVLVWFVDGTKYNVQGNAIVQAARRDFSEACGAIYDAAYDVGPNEIPTFENASVKVEVVEALPDGSYRVRITKK